MTTILNTPFVRPDSKLPCGCQVNSCSCVPPLPSGGVYYVKCKGSGTYLNNSGSSSNPGNPIIGWHKDTTDNMQWKLCLKSGSNTDYYFESVGNGMFIGSAVALQAGAVQATIQRTPVYFTIQSMNDGSYTFNIRGPGSHCFDVDHSSSADGALIWIHPKHGNPNQQWFLEPCNITKPKAVEEVVKPTIPQGLYYVQCWGTGTYLNNNNGVTKVGNPIVARSREKENRALWMLTHKPGSTTEFYFINVANNMKIGYTGSLNRNGVKLTLQDDPVYFQVKDLRNGIRYLCVSGTDYVFDVAGASSAEGTSVLLHPFNAGGNQEWVFSVP